MKRICSKCRNELELNTDNFYLDSHKSMGLSYICKTCAKKKRKRIYKEVSESETRLANQKKLSKEWEQTDKAKAVRRKYEKEKRVRPKYSEWSEERKIKARAAQNKKRSIPKNKISNNISRRVRKFIHDKNGTHVFEVLGYSYEDMFNHLIKTLPEGYTIDDYGTLLHIDHIIPIASYNFSSHEDEDFKRCWNYRNLRFLYKTKNLKKGDDIDLSLIKENNIENLLPIGFQGG